MIGSSSLPNSSVSVSNPSHPSHPVVFERSVTRKFAASAQGDITRQLFNVCGRDWVRYKELADTASQRGNYSQAEAMWLAALIEAKDFDQSDERIAITLENLANLYYTLGRYEQAELFCKRSLEVTVKALGALHTRVGQGLNSLAGIYYNQKRYAEAEPVCLRVLFIYERAFGSDHADVGMAANNLAMLYHAQGRFSDAEKYYQQAIRIRTKVLGTDHPCVGTLLENYANLLKCMNRLHEADALKSWTRSSQQGMRALSAAV